MTKRLPLLDIALFHSNQHLFVERLRDVCHNVGFFLLRHDLRSTLVQEQIDLCRKFFDQPLDEKMKISYEKSPSFRGYMRLGVENTAGQIDHREQIELAAEYDSIVEEAETGATITSMNGPYYNRLKQGKNPFPNNQMEKVCIDYVDGLCHISDRIRQALCLGLKLDKDALTPHFSSSLDNSERPHWQLKMISYPSIPPCDDIAGNGKGQQQGVGPHTDTNFLTLVLQDDVGGLQAFSEGQWIDVPSDLGSDVLVCNLGEQAEIFSNGYFLATPHRVLANKSSRNRISIPFFYNPSLGCTVKPIIQSFSNDGTCRNNSPLPRWERPSDYDQKKHWRRNNNTMFNSVGENIFKSLARSHPEVFVKHHGNDLNILPDGQIVNKKK